MLKRPQWVKEKIEGKEKEVPIQMTVKKKYIMQPQYANMPTMMGMTTGSGVDGTVQPGKMVDVQVHEGEGIVPNNAMQGITGEEFQELIGSLSSGEIDKKKLREAIGMPTVSEYQEGGVIPQDPITAKANKALSDYNAKLEPPQDPVIAKANKALSDYNAAVAAAVPSTPKGASPAVFENVPMVGTVKNPMIATTTTQERDTTEAPTTKVKPIEQQTIQTETVERPPEFKPPPPIPEEEEPPPEDTVTETTDDTAQLKEMVRTGLQRILAETEGVTETDKKIIDYYLQNTDASNAASLRKLEAQISADPYMSDQAKQAAIRGVQREASAIRSEQVGKMAVTSLERASKAARDLISYGQDVRRYEEITKPMSELEMQELENRIGTQNWDEIQSMIDQGLGIDRINQRLAEKGMPPLTTDEFENMFEATPLGERNWNRDLSFAKFLIETPDPSGNNLARAAGILTEKFPGVDVDFSGLLTQQNAATFTQGLTQLASYVESNTDVETAMAAMRADGTIAMLGGDEDLARQLFNANKVNALDEEWRYISTSDIYQGWLNSDDPEKVQWAKDMKVAYDQMVMGMIDRDILHEYKVTNKDTGEVKGSVYAKTPEEAQTLADEMGVGNTIEDTGNIELIIKEPYEETTPATEINDRWNAFVESIPENIGIVPDQKLYERWLSWEKDNPNGTWADFAKTETPTSKLIDIDVETNQELLDKKYYDMLYDAYENNPEGLKESEYFFKMPNKETINREIYTTAASNGVHKTRVSEKMEKILKDSIGLFFEDASGISGQIIDTITTPSTVQLVLKQPGGKSKKVVFYEASPETTTYLGRKT